MAPLAIDTTPLTVDEVVEKIVEGGGRRAGLTAAFTPFLQGQCNNSAVVPPGASAEVSSMTPRLLDKAQPRASMWAYAGAALACVATAAAAFPFQQRFDLPNIIMLFVMTVVLVAVKAGRGPAVLAAVVGGWHCSISCSSRRASRSRSPMPST